MPEGAELRECLEVILGSRPPEPDGEPFLFFSQWLAGRNLGLVPIADPDEFAWPGHSCAPSSTKADCGRTSLSEARFRSATRWRSLT
jgi:hypothetical protein